MTCTTFLSQILGFLLQTLPVALLAFVPFGQKSLRFSRKKLSLFTMAGILVCPSYLPWDIFCFSGRLMHTTSSCALLPICIWDSLFFCLSFSSGFLCAPLRAQKVLILTLLLHYSAILFTITSVVLGVLQKPPYHGPTVVYGTETTFLYLLQVIIIGPVVYAFLKTRGQNQSPLYDQPCAAPGMLLHGHHLFAVQSLCFLSDQLSFLLRREWISGSLFPVCFYPDQRDRLLHVFLRGTSRSQKPGASGSASDV